ncbi:MAG: putative bifunctional diguanylate cyclase/phosphodiesterase [Granulosicoccus sp.]
MFKFIDKENTKLITGLGFFSVFSLMILVSWLSMNTLQSVNSEMSELIESMSEKTSRAYQMRDVIRLRSGAVRTLVQTEDTSERQRIFEQLSEYTRIYAETGTGLRMLGANERESKILAQIAETDERVAEAYRMANNEISTINLDMTVLRKALNSVQLQELVLLNHLNELVKLEKLLAKEALDEQQLTYQRTRKLLLIIVAAAFAMSMIISAIIITRVTRTNRKIAHLANHDDLTGLHNRRSFEQHLTQTLAIAERSENAHGLLYLDLDRFKIVNDTCGHHAGDQLLIQLTQMIQKRLRRGDLFARLGGDEFAIIAQGVTFTDIHQLAEELRIIVNDFDFRYEQESFKVSLSIGATPIDGQVSSIEQVLADVDSACYVAKQAGRNQVHVTKEDDVDIVQYRSNLAGVRAIRKALTDNRLALYYQPVFSLLGDSMDVTHCEILLRIKNEEGEVYSPARFIPIAEKYNVMHEVDQWVFSNVFDWLSENQGKYLIPRLLINISGITLVDDDFSTFIVERMARGDIDPSRIAFEISEAAAVRNIQKVSLFVDKVQALGCELALDDFGSGFSSFSYLKQLPINYLKIDGSMVKKIAEDKVDHDMVAAINQIGHTVGARTIAEFVEDDAALQALRDMKVDYAQGYGLGMPAPLQELSNDLEQRTTKYSDATETQDMAPTSLNKSTTGHRPHDPDDPNDLLRRAS